MIGNSWRILAYGPNGEKFEFYSPEYDKKNKAMCERLKLPVKDNVPLAPDTVLDELCIDNWFHIEQMDHNAWWMQVGDACINVIIKEDGTTDVSVERDVYDTNK